MTALYSDNSIKTESFAELEEYCYRVAGTVGLMTLPILGTAKGVTEEQAKVYTNQIKQNKQTVV
jgi:phytoene/squalene synthetase